MSLREARYMKINEIKLKNNKKNQPILDIITICILKFSKTEYI